MPEGARPAKVPYKYIQSLFPTKSMSPTTEEAIEQMRDPHRSLIGGLMHLANFSRPDIAAAVNTCARFSANLGEDHWRNALTTLKYLKGTPDHGVVYGRPQAVHMSTSLMFRCVDTATRAGRMTPTIVSPALAPCYGGGGVRSSGHPPSRRPSHSRPQRRSTCKYMAARDCVKSVVWGRRLFKEFGYTDLGCPDHDGPLTEEEMGGAKPTVVWEDNSGCVEWSKNPIDFKKRKHIDIAVCRRQSSRRGGGAVLQVHRVSDGGSSHE